jgi:hypothetical protein
MNDIFVIRGIFTFFENLRKNIDTIDNVKKL